MLYIFLGVGVRERFQKAEVTLKVTQIIGIGAIR